MTFYGLRMTLEYMAGESEDVPPWLATTPLWLLRSVVWLIAIVLIYAFCGQSSKFIYIDF
jgi:hypothetical protein